MPPSLAAYVTTAASALVRPRLPHPAVGRRRFRVRLSQCDINVHMNYAAYLEVAELARMDWLIRTGLLRALLSRRWRPLVGSLEIGYRRELKPLQRFEIETRFTGLDRRAMVVEQRLQSRQGEHARLSCNLVVVGPGGVVPRDELEAVLAPHLGELAPA